MKRLFVLTTIVLVGFMFTAAIPLELNGSLSSNSISLFGSNSINSSEKKVTKEFDVKPGDKVVIKLETGGSIEIKGWDKNLLSAEAEIGDNDIEFSFEKKGNEVFISSEYKSEDDKHDSDVNLVISLPKKFNVEFSTMGGEVSISYVDGKMVGKTMGGELDLHHLNGYIDVTTMGGSITLKDSDVDGKAKTMGGEVFVENVKGDINASSMGGNVHHKNVIGKDKSVGNEVNVTTMGGDLDIDTAPNGAKLNTMGGDITINYAGKFLNADTKGGDILAKKVDGWVKAKTMGGDVKVTMVGNPNDDNKDVTLTSMGGDITLTVPDGFSMDIDIQIAYTKNNHHKDFEDCKIVSDFKVNEERTKEWEHEHGTPRKYINGKGVVNGGKNKLTINTINGSVYLKKG